MKTKIFVTLQSFCEYDQTPLDMLKSSGVDFSVNKLGHRFTREETLKYCIDADGIIAAVEPYDSNVLNALPKLKCISRCGVGTDNIDLGEAKKKGIAVFNTPDAVIQPVAEMTVAMIFDLLRKLTLHTIVLKKGEWKKSAGRQLSGKKIGIIGLGRIGKRAAEMLAGLSADVYGFDINPDHIWAKKNNVKLVMLDELLNNSDIISIHVSRSKKDPFVLSEEKIRSLKNGCLIVNTSRGSSVDENALKAALMSGRLAGAALDVFAEEPYKGPLAELDNVVLTPHISTLTVESRIEMETASVRNILRHFDLVN